MRHSLIAAALLIVTFVPHFSSAEAETETMAFIGVTVLPMTGPEPLRDYNVIVRGGVIVRVGPADTTPVPAGALEIPGGGRFLMPGLADMHVHIDHESDLGLYPAYGVTTVLNLRGLPPHLRWRSEIAAGRRFGPTLYTTGDYMDGDPPDMATLMSFSTPQEAAASVTTQKRAGYDFIKVYAELSEEQFLAIGEAARRAKIAVVGHTSDNYSLETVLAGGQVNFAHGEQAGRYLADDGPVEVARVVGLIAASEATVTPNLGLHHAMVRMWEDLDSLLARPEARTLHPAVFQPFRRECNRYVKRSRESYEFMRDRVIRRVERLTLGLHRAGVTLLVGTDSPVAGSYPGSAVWEELAALVKAGLEPYDALVAATVEPGRFIARHLDPEIRFGQVREGYRADLVLLTRNPLEDVRHVDSQVGVMLRGRWFSKPELDERLEARAQRFVSLGEAVKTFEQHLFAGEIERAREVFRGVRGARPGAVLFSQYPAFFIGFGYLYGEGGFNPDPKRLEVALGLYEMYAETYPDFHSSHYMLGQAYLATGDSAKAAVSFERALAIHPFYPAARKALAGLRKP